MDAMSRAELEELLQAIEPLKRTEPRGKAISYIRKLLTYRDSKHLRKDTARIKSLTWWILGIAIMSVVVSVVALLN